MKAMGLWRGRKRTPWVISPVLLVHRLIWTEWITVEHSAKLLRHQVKAPHASQPSLRKAQRDSMHEETPFPGLHFCRIGPGDFPGSRYDPFTPTHGGLASGIFSSEYKRLCCFISIRCGILHRDESLTLFPCFVPERERERVSFSF